MKCDSDDPVIMTCTSALKPALTEQHKLLRVTFCLTKIDPLTCRYGNCMQSVHIDEKWFLFLAFVHCYGGGGANKEGSEEGAHDKGNVSCCCCLPHMIKVMFLAAVACPCYDPEGECTFDGKIGMFPFVERVAAKRTRESCSKKNQQELQERND